MNNTPHITSVKISNRLVHSPCAIVADVGGYTANVQKMMSTIFLPTKRELVTQNVILGASNSKSNQGGVMHEYAIKAKVLEINPRSPLIEGLLRRVEELPAEDDEKDVEAEDELKEVASILIDGALVRSGFEVPDSNK